METIGSETEAYAVAYTISYCKSDVYTINCGMGFGRRTTTFIKAKEIDANTEYYIELLANGTGKSREQINGDIRRPKYLQAQAAIDYFIEDKIANSQVIVPSRNGITMGLLLIEPWKDLEEAVQQRQPD